MRYNNKKFKLISPIQLKIISNKGVESSKQWEWRAMWAQQWEDGKELPERTVWEGLFMRNSVFSSILSKGDFLCHSCTGFKQTECKFSTENIDHSATISI